MVNHQTIFLMAEEHTMESYMNEAMYIMRQDDEDAKALIMEVQKIEREDHDRALEIAETLYILISAGYDCNKIARVLNIKNSLELWL